MNKEQEVYQLVQELETALTQLATEYRRLGLENESIINTMHNWTQEQYDNYYHMRDWLSIN